MAELGERGVPHVERLLRWGWVQGVALTPNAVQVLLFWRTAVSEDALAVSVC